MRREEEGKGKQRRRRLTWVKLWVRNDMASSWRFSGVKSLRQVAISAAVKAEAEQSEGGRQIQWRRDERRVRVGWVEGEKLTKSFSRTSVIICSLHDLVSVVSDKSGDNLWEIGVILKRVHQIL
jgi:hypothetical protein